MNLVTEREPRNIQSGSITILNLVLFWCAWFFINSGRWLQNYADFIEVLISAGLLTCLQALFAGLLIKLYLPKLLFRTRYKAFFLLVFISVFLISECWVVIRYFYLEIQYSETYIRYFQIYGTKPLLERMFGFEGARYVLFIYTPMVGLPGLLLAAYQLFLNQKVVLEIKQKKNEAELKALKSQLNPHFIFNTLNNLYVLALKQSPIVPSIIEKFSDILDYILRKCEAKTVSLSEEVQLINSYLELEKLKYDKRIVITFESQIHQDLPVPPLLFLTIIENAFKHGVANEVGNGYVKVKLFTQSSTLYFSVSNSISKQQADSESFGIGLNNVKHQLDLLYPNLFILQSQQQNDYHYTYLEIAL